MSNNASQEQRHQPPQQEDQDQAQCEWIFSLAAAISPRTSEVSNILGAVELEPSDRLLAIGGISRKIRIYNLQFLLNRQETSSEDGHEEEHGGLVAGGEGEEEGDPVEDRVVDLEGGEEM
ncbi:uncharacterized protein A4U43_C09F800 [Asparagus officinalis]|uniref:Uncharacterized protein n=1 Tax=Asparagus officinalis TaxID=4686 RepID=A0A5P1E939_ASPOF|nr:uncharacterized protein A4U43_C09F800 [Asparagus officinalis]